MLTSFGPINLVRYLIVWRVNSSVVKLPYCFVTDLSFKMVRTIADRLPTREAQTWKKCRTRWEESIEQNKAASRSNKILVPDSPWPIQSSLIVYPNKQIYSQGEKIVWELKLFDVDADHAWFLEVMLPAMEEAGMRRDDMLKRKHPLWGNFDVEAVYAAKGRSWQPIVKDGKLNLRTRVSPIQWLHSTDYVLDPEYVFHHLTWIKPFDFDLPGYRKKIKSKKKDDWVPSMELIMKLLLERLNDFSGGTHKSAAEIWDVIDDNDRETLQEILQQAKDIQVINKRLKRAPRRWPGVSIGRQSFSTIPHMLVPFLELASILHIGRDTHFGNGTFQIS